MAGRIVRPAISSRPGSPPPAPAVGSRAYRSGLPRPAQQTKRGLCWPARAVACTADPTGPLGRLLSPRAPRPPGPAAPELPLSRGHNCPCHPLPPATPHLGAAHPWAFVNSPASLPSAATQGYSRGSLPAAVPILVPCASNTGYQPHCSTGPLGSRVERWWDNNDNKQCRTRARLVFPPACAQRR